MAETLLTSGVWPDPSTRSERDLRAELHVRVRRLRTKYKRTVKILDVCDGDSHAIKQMGGLVSALYREIGEAMTITAALVDRPGCSESGRAIAQSVDAALEALEVSIAPLVNGRPRRKR